jgi:hypothetical protein
MKTVFGFIAGAILIAMPLQIAAQEMTEAQIAQIEAEVLEWAEAWMDSWNVDVHCDATLPLIHPDHVVELTGGAPLKKAEWLEYCKRTNANIAGFTGVWTDTSVRVLSPDAAVFLGRFDGTWEYPDGRTNHRPAGAQLILVERTAEGWGLTLFENSNGPLAEG